MHILEELTWRGLIAQSTDLGALRAAMDAGPVTFYVGFDPTAPSLHIGNLVQLLTARRLQRAGHRPIVLVGGATGLIGDPKPTAERALNDPALVAQWVERIRAQVRPFVRFEQPHAARTVNNLDWTGSLSAIDLLRGIGQHFRVNKMLTKEAVSVRLDSQEGISYTEFSYQLLQANDFLELYRRYGCTLQTAGSDQWGNITAGLDLIHRVTGRAVHGLATPLVTKADGTKFGKTESGTVWLDPQLTSPYAFYQFWLHTDDRDIPGHLRVFSDADESQIAELTVQTAQRPAARDAQRALARELTTLVHGAEQCARVEAAALALFGRGELAELDAETLAAAVAEVPSCWVPDPAPVLAELLVDAGLAASRGAARRLVAEGGVYLNNVRASDPLAPVPANDWLHGRYLVLRRGRQQLAVARRDGPAARI